jgi:hypothetical protein
MRHFRFKDVGGKPRDEHEGREGRRFQCSRRRVQYLEVPKSQIEYPPGVKVSHMDLLLPS